MGDAAFLRRSPLECVHGVVDGKVYKLLELEQEPALDLFEALCWAVIGQQINLVPHLASWRITAETLGPALQKAEDASTYVANC